MKKVVLLSGSPRPNGNSSMLCDEFIRGAAEAGNKAEKILLSRKKVAGCMGCNACYRNGGICVQKDDMEEIKFNINLTLFYSFLPDILYLCKQVASCHLNHHLEL